jgi:ABC-2 type transport system ATP-binding protein
MVEQLAAEAEEQASDEPAPLVRVEQLERRYGERVALHGISFELKRGDVLGLLGPNGAGKSTTLRILAGTLAPGGGGVEIAGHDLFESPVEARQAIGYLAETPPLYPEMRVDEYLNYAARLRRMPRRRVAAAVRRVTERCGLEGSERRLIGHLSKGYRQRVGIAQAVIHEPAVVILDEPTVGLDPNQMREIRHLVTSIGRDHAVIFSSHILPEIEAVSNRVVILHQGRIVHQQRLTAGNRGERVLLMRLVGAEEGAKSLVEQFEGVEEVEWLPEQRLRVVHAAGDEVVARIVSGVVSAGLSLVEVGPERLALEQLFVRHTCGDAGR